MIGIIFQFGNKNIEVVVDGEKCLFRAGEFGGLVPIDNLKLSYQGVCREFPDLEVRKDWREEAIKRFKEKMKAFKTEEERVDYVVNDLKKFGYIPLYAQKNGFRVKRFK